MFNLLPYNKKDKKKIRFRTLLIGVALLITTLFLMAINIFCINNVTHFVLEETDSIKSKTLEQLTNRIDKHLYEIQTITRNLAYSQQLINLVKEFNNSSDIYRKTIIKEDVVLILQMMQKNNKSIDSIAVFTENMVFSSDNGITFTGSNEEVLRSKYDEMLDTNFRPSFLEPLKTSLEDNFYGSLNPISERFSFGCYIGDDNNMYGSIFVLLGKNWLKNIIQSDFNLFLLNNDGETIWANMHTSGIGFPKFNKNVWDLESEKILNINNEKVKIYYSNIRYNNLKLIQLISLNEVANFLKNIKIFIYIDLIISLVLGIFASVIISKNISKPITGIENALNKYVKENNNETFLESKYNKRLSIRKSIILYFFGTFIFPLIVYVFIFNSYINNIIDQKISESFEIIFNQTVINIEEFLDKKEKVVRNVIYNREIQNCLADNIKMDNKMKLVIGSIVSNNLLLDDSNISVNIYKKDRSILVSSDGNVYSKDYVEKSINMLNNKDNWILWLPPSTDDYNRFSLNIIVQIKGVFAKNIGNNFKTIGYAIISVKESELFNVYNNMLFNTSFLNIYNINDKVISSSQKSIITLNDIKKYESKTVNILENKRYYCLESMIEKQGWTVQAMFDYTNAYKERRRLLFKNYYFVMIAIIIVFILSYAISIVFVKPMKKITKLLQNIDDNSKKSGFKVNTFIDEIDRMGIAYNKMVARIDTLINDVYKYDIKRKEAELKVFQAQINPHFLYNTLESVKWLILLKDTDNAVEMITDLGDLLSVCIGRGEKFILIKDEIMHIEKYLSIQKKRYRNKFEVVWDIEKCILEFKTLRFILQPLVENSIYHGIELMDEKGIINICGWRKEQKICFEVKDNGIGISEMKLKSIISSMDNIDKDRSIGIKNVNQRIKLYYGEQYGLEVFSKKGVGTTMKITIPVRS